MAMRRNACLIALAVVLTGCAAPDGPREPALSADEGRARVSRLLPDGVRDRAGWASDIYASLVVLDIAPSFENVCAVIAVTEQESGFRVDPPVPGLSAIAWKEIDRQRASAGIPKLILNGLLAMESSDGRSYAQRLDTVTTEHQLSDLFDDLIGRVPLGRTFLADRNPVRTGGPMQVSIGFAQAHAEAGSYPYPIDGSIRREVFTRRGGMHFGIAHLLGYSASYDGMLYRFADFNAGHYASRNAAFQSAVTQASGIPLALDGDLIRYDGGRPAQAPGNTELAVRALSRRLDMSHADIRRDLELGHGARFDRTPLYVRVFGLADRTTGRAVPRAVVPQILLRSPKITRKLTTEWFAKRVNDRFERCLARSRA